MTICRGASRLVLLVGRLAVKLPRLHRCGGCYPSCFTRFLFGLYANRVEADRWRNRDGHQAERFARVIGGGALLLVMERCAPLAAGVEITPDAWRGIVAESELARENFGTSPDGRTVAVDYAFW